MTFYARKVEYAAHDGECGSWYGSMIELTQKNGCRDGIIVRRVLYQMIFNHNSGIRKFYMCEIPKVGDIENYWIGGKYFVGWDCDQWQKTGSWLHNIAAGGTYKVYGSGTWVKVGRERKRVRRAKTPNMILETRKEIEAIQIEIMCLQTEIRGINDEDFISEDLASSKVTMERELEELKPRLEELRVKLFNVIDELRFTYARKLSVPYWSRSSETLLVEPPKIQQKRRRATKL